jgi:hypothetical protein
MVLKGRKTIRGSSLNWSKDEAVAILRQFTGEDFGTDARKWGDWLSKNRRVYYSGGQVLKPK